MSNAKYDFDLVHVSREHSSIKTIYFITETTHGAIDEIQ